MLLQFFQTYKIPILQAALSILLSLLLTFLKVPIFFLHGLFTYIQPENLGQQNGGGSGIKAAIRRPSSSDSSSGLDGYKNLSSKTNNAEVKRRNFKSKEKFEFDENKAQIFRLKLDQDHLQTRLYFVLRWGPWGKDYGVLVNGSLIPVILACFVLCKVFVSLAKVSFEKSASKRSEKQLSLIFGVLGFVFGLVICSGIASSVFDFDFGSVDGFGRVFVAVVMGCFAGFLYMPGGKNARSFWIGTDQIRSNLAMIYCGWFGRMILYANYLLGFFTALLWINPFAQVLYSKNVNYSYGMHSNGSIGEAEMLVGNVGFTESDFNKFRLWCLLLSGIFQILALRPNVQMHLNEALLSWYQRLHASKVPDLDFSRAKVFLHNHYLCLVVLQFLATPILILLFFSLSQIDGDSFKKFHLWCGFIPCTAFVKEVTLFMAWWIVFVWAAFTSASLFFYRRGTLYVS
ncbi:unnamed protein product [Dovyalis caffra]|uniref:Transmembrane protein 161B n=1 Tax=Dovyalis caffra TaxID=77055 RepID=A0AAV1RPA5_9ROSI|nr:unnamed protein product [Dovyalis caffra]